MAISMYLDMFSAGFVSYLRYLWRKSCSQVEFNFTTLSDLNFFSKLNFFRNLVSLSSFLTALGQLKFH